MNDIPMYHCKIRRLVRANEPNPNTKVVVKNLEDKISEFLTNTPELALVDTNKNIDYDILDTLTINPINCIGKIIGFDDDTFTVELSPYGKTLLYDHPDDYAIGVKMFIRMNDPSICEKIIKFVLYTSKEK